MSDIVDSETVQRLINDPPEYIVPDDLSWLARHVPDPEIDGSDLTNILTFRLRDRYRAMRSCHATRTANVSDFYEQGIRRLDEATAIESLRASLVSQDRPVLDEERFQHALQEVGFDGRSGRVFFAANEKMIIEYGAHYLLYGGELAQSVTIRVWPAHMARERLNALGQATMFVCDVPLALIGDDWLSAYAAEALAQWLAQWLAEALLEPQAQAFQEEALCIHHDLPADAIVGHYHPKRVQDPFGGFQWGDA